MKNTRIFIDELDKQEFVIIDNGDDSFTSMPKSTYDALQAEATKVVDETAPE